MRSSEIARCCDNFFDPCDNFRASDNCQRFGGVIKILAYILVIPAIVVAAVGWYHRKFAVIETKLDSNLDNLTPIKAQQVFQRTKGLMEQWHVTQNDLVNYLVNYVEPSPGERYLDRFQKGFAHLEPKFQKAFFEKVIENDTFELALTLIPRNIEELHISSGNPNAIKYAAINRKNADLILKHLGEFDQLKKLTLHFPGIGFFGPGANRRLAVMAANGDLVLGGEEDYLGIVRILGTEYHYTPLDTHPILLTFKTVRDLAKKNPQLNYDIDLMNIAINKYGFTGRSTFDESEYALTIADYMNK